jgi:hypothetical protein
MAGRSTLMQIWAVVGDEGVAQSAAFAELRTAHELLVEGLAEKSDDQLAEDIRKCSALSDKLEPRLAAFYSAVPGRKADFP